MSRFKNFQFEKVGTVGDFLDKVHPFLKQHGAEIALEDLKKDDTMAIMVMEAGARVEAFYKKPEPQRNIYHDYIVKRHGKWINVEDGPFHLLAILYVFDIIAHTSVKPSQMQELGLPTVDPRNLH
jgi:hypothetical protein